MYKVIDGHSHSYDSPQYFQDVFLFGREGIPLQGDQIINRFTNFKDDQLVIWLAHHENDGLTTVPGVTLPLYGDWCGNFWHWCNEALPVALAAHRQGFSGTYLVPPIPFVIDTLTWLGIPRERIREDLGGDYHLECMCLLGKRFSSDPANLEAMGEIRQIFRSLFASGNPTHRIYISRNGAHVHDRKIVNELELLELLDRFGFTTLLMEHLNLEDQLRYTCNATALVGPHGAGMAHCAFLPEGSLVVEHFSPVYVNPCMVPICRRYRHRYFQVTSYRPHDGYLHGQNIYANIPLIEMTLERELG